MKYKELYTQSIAEPEAFGQIKPIKLLGIVNPRIFYQKMKMTTRFGTKTVN
jgi:hypothetical protein